jgi:hypothetical protein
MSTPGAVPSVDSVVEQALAAEAAGKQHDPRIDRMYRRDVIVIYAFVVVLWATLWLVFFLVANPVIHDNLLRWLMIALGAVASIFNTTGMVSNTLRLRHEAVRFYSQDIFWQDEKKKYKQEEALWHEQQKQQKRLERKGMQAT